MTRFLLLLLSSLGIALLAPLAQGQQGAVKRIPPAGKAIPADERRTLTEDKDSLGKEIEQLKSTLKGKLLDLIPDVQIFYNAVHYALVYDEFFNVKETVIARKLTMEGHERVKALQNGQAPWTTATGLVVRGYVSRIDAPCSPMGWWFRQPSRLAPIIAIGSTCGITAVAKPSMKSVSSMGARPTRETSRRRTRSFCTSMAVTAMPIISPARSTPWRRWTASKSNMQSTTTASWCAGSRWVARRPGTSPSTIPIFGPRLLPVPAFRNLPGSLSCKLTNCRTMSASFLHMYDCIDWAANLSQLPVVAYSGEIDGQKQAADIMEKAMAKEGLKLVHVIGPKTGHAYEKNAKVEINRLIDAHAAQGRNPAAKEDSLRHLHSSLPQNVLGTCRWHGPALGRSTRGGGYRQRKYRRSVHEKRYRPDARTCQPACVRWTRRGPPGYKSMGKP